MLSASNFVEAIRVDPFTVNSCKPDIILGISSWQNPINPFDVNNDGIVDEKDYNDLQSWLDVNGERILEPVKPNGEIYVDVSGSKSSSFNDLILLYNKINNIKSDNRSLDCLDSSGFNMFRDLMLPRTGLTVRNVAAFINAFPIINYSYYIRSSDNILSEVGISELVDVRKSVVAINNLLFSIDNVIGVHSNIVSRVQARLTATIGILPSRDV